MDDIIELHRALLQAQGIDSTTERYKIHIANVQEDIRVLSEEFNATKTAQLNVPIEMVEQERARMDECNQIRRKFLATGDLNDLPQIPGTPTVYTIFQK